MNGIYLLFLRSQGQNQGASLPWFILGMSLFALLINVGEGFLLGVLVISEQLHWKIFSEHGLWLPHSLTDEASSLPPVYTSLYTLVPP